MKIMSIVGARPQFIKASALSRKLRRHHTEFLVHTGQHYDYEMSQLFFDQLNIPKPEVNLEVGSGRQGEQTAIMLIGLEKLLINEKPDRVLIYGDTNSTLAGALAAAKLSIPIAHVEAGMRSFQRSMPEEINRILADHLSNLLLCSSKTAVKHLANEGITKGVHLVGDVMFDVLSEVIETVQGQSDTLEKFGISKGKYLLLTIHRPRNTDNDLHLKSILETIETAQEPVIFPIHPRTSKALRRISYTPSHHIQLVDPVSYTDMVQLEKSARMILTDSGGVQKEAYWLGIPCLTLREETEWIETVEQGWNRLVGADPVLIHQSILNFCPPQTRIPLYGQGQAAKRCYELLIKPVN